MTKLDVSGRATGWPHWRTPTSFMRLVEELNFVVLDPCDNETHSNTRAAHRCIGPAYGGADGLAVDWLKKSQDLGLVYVNPPYNEMRKWVDKMVEEAEKGCEILALVPARTGAKWFHDLCEPFTRGVFWKGRIQFENPPPDSPGSRSSVDNFVAYHGPRADRFEEVFGPYGLVVR